MLLQRLFIPDSPFFAVTVTGCMAENFQVGQELILANRTTRAWCRKIVQRVVDTDDGNCVLDLYL